jgi:DNA helicase-2/ATP-dependent DNA helicase PcrA
VRSRGWPVSASKANHIPVRRGRRSRGRAGRAGRSNGRWPWHHGPVCKRVAGTGKTRAVAHRIAYAALTGVVDPAHVLAVTFTTRAAGVAARLVQLAGPAAAGVVQAHLPLAALQLVHLAHRAATRPCSIQGEPAGRGGPRAAVSAGAAELRDVASEISGPRRRRCGRMTTRGRRQSGPHPAAAEVVARLYGRYEDLRHDRHLVDFESVLSSRGHHRRARAGRRRGQGPVPLFRDR